LLVAPIALAIAAAPAVLHAQDKDDAAATKHDDSKPAEKPDLPPLPADASVRHSAVIGGNTISYTPKDRKNPIYK
jgi:hypothetical protein